VRGKARGDGVIQSNAAQCRDIEVDHGRVLLLRSARTRGHAAAHDAATVDSVREGRRGWRARSRRR
jgi:hypothetical protein